MCQASPFEVHTTSAPIRTLQKRPVAMPCAVTCAAARSGLAAQHRRRLSGGPPGAAATAAVLGGRPLLPRRAGRNGARWTCAQWLENRLVTEGALEGVHVQQLLQRWL